MIGERLVEVEHSPIQINERDDHHSSPIIETRCRFRR
jgi:hypothetical protein